jgi:hypothetical protein
MVGPIRPAAGFQKRVTALVWNVKTFLIERNGASEKSKAPRGKVLLKIA